MKVLVTGGTGFIGRNLINKALKDRSKVVVSRQTENPFREDSSVSFLRCDLRDFRDLNAVFRKNAVDTVVHLASTGVSDATSQDIWDTNVCGTLNLLEVAAAHGIRRFIHIGSCFELLGAGIYSESESGVFRRTYTVSKVAQTSLVSEFSARRNLPAVTLRLFSVYGPGEPAGRLFPTILKAAMKGKCVDLSPGRRKRDYVFVDDVVRAIDKAVRISRFPRGRILEISSGETLSVRNIVSILRRKPYTSQLFKPRFGHRPYDVTDVPILGGSPESAKHVLRCEARVKVSQGLDLFHAAIRRA